MSDEKPKQVRVGATMPAEGKELIKKLIVEDGMTNDEIIAVLRERGYPEVCGAPYFTPIRQDPEIKKALAEKKAAMCQQGMGQASTRFLKLSAVAARLERQLVDGGDLCDLTAKDKFGTASGLFILDRYVKVFEQIRKEVGDEDAKREVFASDEGLTVLRGLINEKDKTKGKVKQVVECDIMPTDFSLSEV